MARHGIKAAKIREALTAKPEASVKDIITTLKAQKVSVVPAQVYAIRSSMNNGTTKNSSARGKAKAKSNQFAALIQAKKLADALGGVDKAKAALDVLAQLL
jgi:hypothetical protein